MTQTAELGIPGPNSGRQIKFTPERIQQIKNLVERGKSREEIAELIGATVGSLQVTCSRFGISLRRPTLNQGTFSLRREKPRFNRVSTPSGSALLQVLLERHARPGPWPAEQAPRPCQAQDAAPWQDWRKRAAEAFAATFAIRIRYRGEERTTELPLSHDIIGLLALEAAFRNVTIGELIGQFLVAVADKDLLQTVLESSVKEPEAIEWAE